MTNDLFLKYKREPVIDAYGNVREVAEAWTRVRYIRPGPDRGATEFSLSATERIARLAISQAYWGLAIRAN